LSSNSKVLAMKREAAANFGAGGSADYGAKKHGNSAYRPVMSVTSHQAP
jgi:hypothetical protein